MDNAAAVVIAMGAVCILKKNRDKTPPDYSGRILKLKNA